MKKQIKNWQQGMTPYINGDGIFRLEHFDTTENKLRPYRSLADGSVDSRCKFVKFIKVGSDLYALANDGLVNSQLIVMKWDANNYFWDIYQSINENGSYAEMLFYYNGHFYGLWKSAHLWRITSGVLDKDYQDRTYTYYADPIIHSKDGLVYLPTDNIINRLSSDGTTLIAVLTLPSTFVITSIAEQGDFINIVGYDSVTYRSTSFVWDRDSSLATVTSKYDLGQETVYHNVVLGGIPFFISQRSDSSNTNFLEKQTLVIKYISGDNIKIKSEFQFYALGIGGKYVDGNKIYFNIYFRISSTDSNHYATFCLDELGRLSIAQNISINDNAGTESQLPGIIRDGDGFWIGGRADGVWNSIMGTNGDAHIYFLTESILETTQYQSPNLTKSLDLIGITVAFDPLPTGASVVLKTRADAETDWTTLAVDSNFSTLNSIKGVFPNDGTVTTAKNRQFRVESLGGAVITDFQVDFDEVNDEAYG
jgi:hypothetical protein